MILSIKDGMFFSDMDEDVPNEAKWTEEKLDDKLSKLNCTIQLHQYNWNQLPPPLDSYRRAAVLIPLFVKDGEVHVWLTKRSHHVGADKGHVAFPGGMADAGDTDESATCLREAEEEIGLQAHQVHIITSTMPRVNSRDIFVYGRVGIVHQEFVPMPNEEVAFVFHLPLKRFLEDIRHTFKEYDFKGSRVHVHYFSDCAAGEEVTTWGLTAAMCVELAVALLQKETEFDCTPEGKLKPPNVYEEQVKFLTNLK